MVDKRVSSEPLFEHEWRVSVSRASSLQIKSIFPWRLVPSRNPNKTYCRESKGIHSSFFPMLSRLVKPERWIWGFTLSLRYQNNDYLTCFYNWSRREISTCFDFHLLMLTIYRQINSHFICSPFRRSQIWPGCRWAVLLLYMVLASVFCEAAIRWPPGLESQNGFTHMSGTLGGLTRRLGCLSASSHEWLDFFTWHLDSKNEYSK